MNRTGFAQGKNTEFKKDFRSFFQSFSKLNSQYLGSQLDQSIAVEQRATTQGLYIPRVTLGWTQNETDQQKNEQATLGILGTVPELGVSYDSTLYNNIKNIKPEPQTNSSQYSFGLGLSLLKDAGYMVGRSASEQIEIQSEITRLTAEQIRYDVIYQFLQTYLNAVAAQKNLQNARSNFAKAEVDFKNITALLQAGKVARLTALTVQTQKQRLKLQVLRSERNLRDSLKQLYVLSMDGQDIDQILNENTSLEPLKMPLYDDAVIQNLIKKQESADFAKNLELQLSRLSLADGQIAAVLADNETWPALDIKFIYDDSKLSDSTPGFFSHGEITKTVGLTLSMPISFVTERHNKAIAYFQLQKKQFNFENKKLQIKQEWSNLARQYANTKEIYTISKELVQSANQRYQESLPTASMGSTFQQNVINYQNELVAAQVEFNQVEAELNGIQYKILTFFGSPYALSFLKNLN